MPPDSPPLIAIQALPGFDGKEVTLRGWMMGKRSGGKIQFLLIRDGTGVCQCIVEAGEPELFATARKLTQESSILLTGTARLDERAPGGCELSVTGLSVLQQAEEYPISRKAHGIDFLMNHRHLWLRSARQAAIMRIRHTIIKSVRDFFDEEGFTLIDTPIFTPGAAEDTGTLFPVDYFGEEVYLAQTGQLYLESACMALGKVYCFGPTFRAEKSKTRRHLTEFWMVEPEIAFAELTDLQACAEAMVSRVVSDVVNQHEKNLNELGRNLEPLKKIKPPFPRLTYSEAVDILRSTETREQLEQEQEQGKKDLDEHIRRLDETIQQRQQAKKAWQTEKLDHEIHTLRETIKDLEEEVKNRPLHMEQASSFEWGKDLGGAEETILSRRHDKPLFVTEYPKEAKAFYMKNHPTNPRVVLNMDLLAPEGYGEIIGGSQREEDIGALKERMAEMNMDPGPYEWYLDLRRYGSVPHGGFGLGIERTVSWICGLQHVRETIPFPRLMGKMYP